MSKLSLSLIEHVNTIPFDIVFTFNAFPDGYQNSITACALEKSGLIQRVSRGVYARKIKGIPLKLKDPYQVMTVLAKANHWDFKLSLTDVTAWLNGSYYRLPIHSFNVVGISKNKIIRVGQFVFYIYKFKSFS